MHCHILDSVILHNDLTEETITYIYIQYMQEWAVQKNKKKHWYTFTFVTFVKKGIALILNILHM